MAAGVCSSVGTLLLAWFRAQERAQTFCILTLVQFVTAVGLNVVLVAGFGAGIYGVFLGTLASNTLLIALATMSARRTARWLFNPRLVRPLLGFGLYLIPAMLAGWVMDLSDRYLLRVFSGLDAVAVYGVGYKFGMIAQVAIVWPFQLAWPAFSFSISNHPRHRATYARTLTYLVATLLVTVLFLSLLTPILLPMVVGRAYRDAMAVVPLVALAYAFNGVHYCLAPGVHLAGRTRYLSVLAGIAALMNVGLNLVLIPRVGMIGAAWSTVIAFACLAITTGLLGQRVYPIAYEYARLAKLVVAAAVAYIATQAVAPATTGLAIAWQLGVPALAFPTVLVATGFLAPEERRWLAGLVSRYILVLGETR